MTKSHPPFSTTQQTTQQTSQMTKQTSNSRADSSLGVTMRGHATHRPTAGEKEGRSGWGDGEARKKDDGGALTRVVEVGGAPASSEKRPWRPPACLLRPRGKRAKQGQTYRYSSVGGAAAPGSRRRESARPYPRRSDTGWVTYLEP
jgi:hypothetical protein